MEAMCRTLVSGMGRRMLQNQVMHHNVTRATLAQNAYRSQRPTSISAFGSSEQKRFCSVMPPRAGDNLAGQINGTAHLSRVLEREIQDEMAEMNSKLNMDRIPGFDIETDGAEVKLTRRHDNNETVVIRFNVSSSLHEMPIMGQPQSQNAEEEADMGSELVSMPEFQVQVRKGNKTLEFNCYFAEPETDEETGAPVESGVEFDIQEMVLYEGEPKESEFVVSTDFLDEDMSASLFNYLGERGVDEEFARNLVNFATGYEKRQYINMMERFKSFIK